LEVASMPRRGGTSIATSNERQDTGSKHKLATIRSNNREFNHQTRLQRVVLHYVGRKNGEGQEERKGEWERTQRGRRTYEVSPAVCVLVRATPFLGYRWVWTSGLPGRLSTEF
jgi:hypothetical protein